jgi:hypothetical protein
MTLDMFEKIDEQAKLKDLKELFIEKFGSVIKIIIEDLTESVFINIISKHLKFSQRENSTPEY